ncbi:MAG: hypothetical protein KGI90_03625 [Burkholderiales bacterium]|nr:hypothetical protein [Burkholderiales bacterium]
MPRRSGRPALCLALSLALAAGGCATRAADVAPAPTNPAEFLAWDCSHIDDELDRVQLHAVDVAYAVDQRAATNIVALGVGLSVFWPALVAMRPAGLDAAELARLKGRFEALHAAARSKGCPPAADRLSAAHAAALPLTVGDRLVYEDRPGPHRAAGQWVLRLTAIHRGELDYRVLAPRSQADAPDPTWRQDLVGNVLAAPPGALQWPHLLRSDLKLGAIVGGDLGVAGDPFTHARLLGQVVAVGPQDVAGRHFDAAVVELFGDAPSGNASTRVEGAIVVDRVNGVLLRLDLRSANPSFSLQRRLVRVESAGG